jgi:hypothetical protein
VIDTVKAMLIPLDLLFLVCFTIIYWLGVDLQHQSFNTGKTEYLKGILVPVYFKWKTGNRKTDSRILKGKIGLRILKEQTGTRISKGPIGTRILKRKTGTRILKGQTDTRILKGQNSAGIDLFPNKSV